MDVVQHLTGRALWVALRERAGYSSDRALERAAGLTAGTIWTWTVSGSRGVNPRVDNLSRVASLLGVSLDAVNETIVSWRAELAVDRQPRES